MEVTETKPESKPEPTGEDDEDSHGSKSGSVLLGVPSRTKGATGRRAPTRKSVIMQQGGRARSATIAMDR